MTHARIGSLHSKQRLCHIIIPLVRVRLNLKGPRQQVDTAHRHIGPILPNRKLNLEGFTLMRRLDTTTNRPVPSQMWLILTTTHATATQSTARMASTSLNKAYQTLTTGWQTGEVHSNRQCTQDKTNRTGALTKQPK